MCLSTMFWCFESDYVEEGAVGCEESVKEGAEVEFGEFGVGEVLEVEGLRGR